MTWSLLVLGFLTGLRHALEADHVAAVAAMAAGERRRGRIVQYGVLWGSGHTTVLFLVSGGAVAFGWALGERFGLWVDLAVGLVVAWLGVGVLRRLRAERIHAHLHHHGDGRWHLHFHSHAGESGPHDPAHHRHEHPPGPPWRAFAVGLLHGLAGSGPLVVLVAGTTGSLPLALAYVLIFGLGSIAGMGLLSLVLAWPLGWSAHNTTRLARLVRTATGLAAIAVGLELSARALWSLWGV